MDEIEKRLRESTDACIKSFEAWVKASKSLETRETLMEAMHEVRKVVSRLEIEIAISERDRLGSRPLPIPPHRSQKKRGGEGGGDDADFNRADEFDGDDAGQPQGGDNQQRRHSGGGGGGRGRRPMHRGGGGGGNSNGGGNAESA